MRSSARSQNTRNQSPQRGRRRDDHERLEPVVVGRLDRRKHAAEVVTDDSESAGVHIRAGGDQVDRRAQPRDLGQDLRPVRIRTGRRPGPGETALRKQAHGSSRGEVGRLVQELGAVPVGCLGIQPMPHHQPGRGPRFRGARRPNEIRLDLEPVRAIEDDVIDERAATRLSRAYAWLGHRHLLACCADRRLARPDRACGSRTQARALPACSQTHARLGRPVPSNDAPHLDVRPDQALSPGRHGPRRPDARSRTRDHRSRRGQRRGQEHAHQDPARAPRADLGRGQGHGPRRPDQRPRPSASSSATCPSTTACPPMRPRPISSSHMARMSGLPSTAVARADGRGPPSRRPVRGALSADRRLLDRHEAAGEARPGTGPRAAVCSSSTNRRTDSTRPAVTRCWRSCAEPAPSSGSR